MSVSRIVPIAYVTKWAGAIRVMRNAETSASNPKYLRLGGGRLAGPTAWTEDRATAVGRYQKALRKRMAAAQKELATCSAALAREPEFTEEE